MADKGKILQNLTGKSNFKKISSLKKLVKLEKVNNELIPIKKDLAPLHFTSDAYYSLYSPTVCAYVAYKCGATVSSINDYATLCYYKEFKKACKVLKMPYSCGYHINCKPLFEESVAKYYAYGITAKDAKLLNAELKPYREEKKKNLLKIIEKVNDNLKDYGITLLEKEVFKNVRYKDSCVTEKDVAKALAEKLADKFEDSLEIVKFLKEKLLIDSCEGDLRFIVEKENNYFVEDLAKVLYVKYSLLKPIDKLEDSKTFIELSKKYGAISSYKLEISKFNKENLSNIANVLLEKGFNAVTIKFNNIKEKDALKVVDYFYERGLLTISLYRIGLPRQHMPQSEVSDKLYLNALAVVGSSSSCECDYNDSLFSENTIKLCPDLIKRVEIFSNIVKKGN